MENQHFNFSCFCDHTLNAPQLLPPKIVTISISRIRRNNIFSCFLFRLHNKVVRLFQSFADVINGWSLVELHHWFIIIKWNCPRSHHTYCVPHSLLVNELKSYSITTFTHMLIFVSTNGLLIWIMIATNFVWFVSRHKCSILLTHF